LRSSELAPLLDEEAAAWRETLDWDFTASAELVQRFVEQRALHGFALLDPNGGVVGYSYFVQDEHKGLIGDLYVRRAWRTVENERRLLSSVVEALIRAPFLTRIETQLMMLGPGHDRHMPGARFLSVYDRNFMRADLSSVQMLNPTSPRGSAVYQQWEERYQEAAAQLIPDAYAGHIDSRINDQYDTVPGSRRFLYNVVQYPGCGNFCRAASYAALDRSTCNLRGISLASRIAPNVGHITQICVSKQHRGTGIGYELLRHSLRALREAGCRAATLTVTASNRDAIRLYEQVGFRTIRTFSAFVWDGF
ncbi:MAG: GNAT family N-acetyltransferase, partial [Bryobacteraceae bacterium]